MLSSSGTHFTVNPRVSFLIAEYYSSVSPHMCTYTYHSLSVWRWIHGLNQTLAIVNSVARNMVLWLWHTVFCSLDHMASMFLVSKQISTLFSTMAAILTCLQTVCEFPFFHILTSICYYYVFWILSMWQRWEVSSSFDVHFPVGWRSWTIFIVFVCHLYFLWELLKFSPIFFFNFFWMTFIRRWSGWEGLKIRVRSLFTHFLPSAYGTERTPLSLSRENFQKIDFLQRN